MSNETKIFWIGALLVRNNMQLTPPLNMPNGLTSQDGKTFSFKDGSFTAEEAQYYLKHKTLDSVEKQDSERLTKREEVALRIACAAISADKTADDNMIKNSYLFADAFLEESSK